MPESNEEISQKAEKEVRKSEKEARKKQGRSMKDAWKKQGRKNAAGIAIKNDCE